MWSIQSISREIKRHYSRFPFICSQPQWSLIHYGFISSFIPLRIHIVSLFARLLVGVIWLHNLDLNKVKILWHIPVARNFVFPLIRCLFLYINLTLNALREVVRLIEVKSYRVSLLWMLIRHLFLLIKHILFLLVIWTLESRLLLQVLRWWVMIHLLQLLLLWNLEPTT